jgi:hypothetical protein
MRSNNDKIISAPSQLDTPFPGPVLHSSRSNITTQPHRIIAWLPNNLPLQLQGILASQGIPTWAVCNGCLVEEGQVDPTWRLELSIELSAMEGEGMMGAMWPEAVGEWRDWEPVLESESEGGEENTTVVQSCCEVHYRAWFPLSQGNWLRLVDSIAPMNVFISCSFCVMVIKVN